VTHRSVIQTAFYLQKSPAAAKSGTVRDKAPREADAQQPAYGNQDVYYSRSWWLTGLWSQPRNLGDGINTPVADQRATLSHDGKRMYFGSNNDLYVSERKQPRQ
jgi:hypothetical protein